ncbi:MAG: adenosylcobinamide-GDP ribazoletransferase [Roseobacter sp.]|jgi:adenosylcobinamide-GDP ribazoletransferase
MKLSAGSSIALDIALAFVLLTRLPMPRLAPEAFGHSTRAVWAYPLVGAAIGAIAWGGGQLALAAELPAPVVAGLMIAAMVLCSGAMHEDGLADIADGFWGAQSAEKRLEIMKDSQIGTYGTLAIVIVTGLRWTALAALIPVNPAAVLAAACISRSAMPVLMYALPPARSAGLSASVGRPRLLPVLFGVGLASMLSATVIGSAVSAAFLIGVVATFSLAVLASRKIGGQTGDVLGATQQLCETLILLALCLKTA